MVEKCGNVRVRHSLLAEYAAALLPVGTDLIRTELVVFRFFAFSLFAFSMYIVDSGPIWKWQFDMEPSETEEDLLLDSLLRRLKWKCSRCVRYSNANARK